MIPHPESVSEGALALLRSLSEMAELQGAALGGGTSLALVHGHRRSIDLDFFFESSFDPLGLQEALAERFASIGIVNRTQGSLCAVIQGVKVDFLRHSYPLLQAYADIEGIRILSVPDLAAMKVNAVANRGSKKDFSDLLLLHERGIPLRDSLKSFCLKYGQEGKFLAIRSLNWFGDTEGEPDPVYLNGWTWEGVRTRMEAIARSLIDKRS